ncbi:Spermatogenesis-associated protein 17 [Lamellibrachia satsuma]|nr:Spermatogenesis-associated protein 17 [Lamellibrachia satsuma]
MSEHLREADEHAIGDYCAARNIQSWFRSLRVRSYIKYLNRQAVQIQRRWRGLVGRAYFVQCLLKKVELLQMGLYHGCATTIQTVWRGHSVRVRVLDFYKRNKYLKALTVANAIARQKLAEYREFLDAKEDEERRAREAAALAVHLRKTHYLVSTSQVPGVYNSPYRERPTEMETRLKAVETKICKRKKKKPEDPPRNLPPLPQKQMGPFLEPWEVQRQRYRPPRPSLRAQSDFYSVEKARKQMKLDDWMATIGNDRMEIRRTRPPPYVEDITTRGNTFATRGYGIDRFRDEFPEKFLAGKDFKLVVLDHRDDVYSKCYSEMQFP